MIGLLLNIALLITSQTTTEKMVMNYLQEKIEGYTKIEVSLLGDWERYNDLKIDEDKEPKLSGNIAYIPVVFTNHRGVNYTTLSAEVKLYDEVLVAVDNIGRNEELLPNSFELKIADVTTVKEPVKSFLEISGKISREYIRAEEVLSGLSIINKPLVDVGDRVNAHSIVGNVDINVAAVARQSGYEGEVIRIRTAEKNLFKAKVLDRNNVLIIE